VEDETIALQAWRLRYFEQRVGYLEGQMRAPAPLPVLAPVSEEPPVQEWAAREAQARAAFLEDELRAARAAREPVVDEEIEAEPFAANADVDMLLRWRLLYLERRVAHLQERAEAVAEAPPQAVATPAQDGDRWKWRARYLEARVRHLEQRPSQVVCSGASARG
jgi:hypothetical protein